MVDSCWFVDIFIGVILEGGSRQLVVCKKIYIFELQILNLVFCFVDGFLYQINQ